MNGTRRELRRWREAVQSGDARRAHHFLNERQLLFRFLHYFVAKGSTYQNKHVLLKLIMNKQN